MLQSTPFNHARRTFSLADVAQIPDWDTKVERLSGFIDDVSTGTVDSSAFEHSFPALMECIFGKRSSAGPSVSLLSDLYRNGGNVDALYQMLMPEGKLFHIMKRRYSEQGTKYPFDSVSYLLKPRIGRPSSVQKYFSKQFEAVERQIQLGMMEFYFMSFFNYANSHVVDYTGPILSADLKTQTNYQNTTIYFRLLEDYLRFFMQDPVTTVYGDTGAQPFIDTIHPFAPTFLSLFTESILQYVTCLSEVNELHSIWAEMTWDEVKICPSTRAYTVFSLVKHMIAYCSKPGYTRRTPLMEQIRIPLYGYFRASFLFSRHFHGVWEVLSHTLLIYLNPWMNDNSGGGYDQSWKTYVLTNSPFFNIVMIDMLNSIPFTDDAIEAEIDTVNLLARTYTKELMDAAFSPSAYTHPLFSENRRELQSNTIGSDIKIEYYSVNGEQLARKKEIIDAISKFVRTFERKKGVLENRMQVIASPLTAACDQFISLLKGYFLKEIPETQSFIREPSEPRRRFASEARTLQELTPSERTEVVRGHVTMERSDDLVRRLRQQQQGQNAGADQTDSTGQRVARFLTENSNKLLVASVAAYFASQAW